MSLGKIIDKKNDDLSKRIDKQKVPEHVAIIMDGNGRWAREKGLPRREGHRAGAESVREVVEGCKKLGVRFLTLYAFSSENWNRPKAEIHALMALLKEFLRVKTPEMKSQGVRLHAIGRLEDLPTDCQKELSSAIEQTASNSDIDLLAGQTALACVGRPQKHAESRE